MKIINFLIAIWALAFLLNACANKAQGPTGGPKDETPPKVVRSSPANGELNFRKKQIQVIFDENITLEKEIEEEKKRQAEKNKTGQTIVDEWTPNIEDLKREAATKNKAASYAE